MLVRLDNLELLGDNTLIVYPKLIKMFKEQYSLHYLEGEYLEESINQGSCGDLAYLLKLAGEQLGEEVSIVRSYSHWFIRVKSREEILYYDAYAEEGTKDLLVITDNLPGELEVWDKDKLLELFKPKVSKLVNIKLKGKGV